MSDPEALVWAAAFAHEIAAGREPDTAAMTARRAVAALRNFRVRGRDQQPFVETLVDFRDEGDYQDDGGAS